MRTISILVREVNPGQIHTGDINGYNKDTCRSPGTALVYLGQKNIE